MKEIEKKRSIKKIILIISISLAGLVLILGASAYLLIHNYISKMNLVDSSEDQVVYAGDSSSDEYSDDGDIDIAYEDQTDNDDTVSSESTDSGTISGGAAELSGQDSNDVTELEEVISRNTSSEDIMKDDHVLNILLIGSDTRKVEIRGLSDSMIIISINSNTKKITATSLLRDIYLSIPGRKNNRLNEAYLSGGAKLLMDTIENNFKIKIDRYIAVDFLAFIDIVDEIGGVTIDVTDKELPYINNYIENQNRIRNLKEDRDILAKAGLQLLNGNQALGYARVRYVGTDFGRTERQRKVLERIFEKFKKLSMTELNQLLADFLPKVTTNFKESEIFAQILKLPDYMKYKYDQWGIPMQGTYKDLNIRGMEVLGIDFEENINELRRKVYQAE